MNQVVIFSILALVLSACNGNPAAPSGSVPINEIAGAPSDQTTPPQDNNILVYDQTQGKWVPKQAQVAMVDGLQADLDAKANSADVQADLANKVDQTAYQNSVSNLQSQITTNVQSDQTAIAGANNAITTLNTTQTALQTQQQTDEVNVASQVGNLQGQINAKGNGALANLNTVGDAQITGVSGAKVSGALSNATIAASAVTGQIAAAQIAAVNGSTVSGALGSGATIGDNQVNGLQTDLTGKLSTAGGQMTGEIQVNNRDDNSENTLVTTGGTGGAALGLVDQAKVWFNSVAARLKFWDGSQSQQVATSDEVGAVSATVDSNNQQINGTVSGVQTQVNNVAGAQSATQAELDSVSNTVTANQATETSDVSGLTAAQGLTNSAVTALQAATPNYYLKTGGTITGSMSVSGSVSANTVTSTGTISTPGNVSAGSIVSTGSTTTNSLAVANGLTVSSGAVSLPSSSVAASAINNSASRFVETSGNFTMSGQLATTSQISFKSFQATGSSIDWNNGQLQYITLSACEPFVFVNLVDGGSYTLAVTVTGSAASTCAFSTSDSGLTDANFKSLPDKNVPAPAIAGGTATEVFSFLRIGSNVYMTNTGPF
jgi:hypothetical protein